MTPSLARVYESLIATAAGPRCEAEVAALRRAMERRIGPFSSADPWFDERSAALWDRVLTAPEVLARLDGPRDAVDALSRAQRGLFTLRAERAVDLTCLVTGAAFRVAAEDETARALARGTNGVAPCVFDAIVAPTEEGVAILPGVLAHPPEATDPIRAILATDAPRAMTAEDLFDALLAMRHRLAAAGRMRAHQVYRAEWFAGRR